MTTLTARWLMLFPSTIRFASAIGEVVVMLPNGPARTLAVNEATAARQRVKDALIRRILN